MDYANKQSWAQLLLIIGGFILAETIIRSFIELSEGNLSPWVLPLYGVAMIFGASELIAGKGLKSPAAWIYDIFLGISIVLIVLVKSGNMNNILFLWLILVGSLITIVSWIVENLKKKKK